MTTSDLLEIRGKAMTLAPILDDPESDINTVRSSISSNPVRRRVRSLGQILKRSPGLVLLLILWQVFLSAGVLRVQTLAGPLTVARTFFHLIANGELPHNMLASLARVGIGLLFGVALGLLLAVGSGLTRLGENFVDAPMQMMRTLPILALAPLDILWFGIGDEAKVVLIMFGVMFPIYLNTFAAIRGIDQRYVELGGTLGLSRWQLIRSVIIPGALPGFLVGLRFAVGTSWLILVVSEQINANSGIGYLMEQAQQFDETNVILVCLVVYGFLGITTDFFVRTLEEEGTDMALSLQRDLRDLDQGGLDRWFSTTRTGDRGRSAVVARNVRRSFGNRLVLSGVDLSIERGEFVALLGRSGTGKSTLLRVLAGLDKQITGTVVVPERRSVVFQDARLLPWMRVNDNVALGLKGNDVDGRARRALVEVGLEDHAHAWPRTLSGGEAQRASLARALVRDPELLLLDEPFGALDALTRIQMHELLHRLCRIHSPGVLLVTYDVDEAILLADRVLVMVDGHIAVNRQVNLTEPRQRYGAQFAVLRRELLRTLGVNE